MQSENSMALVCPDLRIRQDIGHGSGEYKQISIVDCKAAIENRPCKYSGNCIVRKNYHGHKLKKGDKP